LLDVAFTPSGTAIVVGSNGTIMRRSLGGTSAVTDTHVPPRAFRLEQPGSHQVQFDAEGLPSGVYLYSVSTGGQRQTRKMLLLR
jgi:hypothetical protein